MKKSLLLVFALVVAAACSAPPANHETAPAANANSSSAPPTVAMTEAGAIANEKAVWDAIKNKDYAAFGNMLADDQIEVTSQAVNDKAGSIAAVKDFEPAEVVFSDWKFLSIDKDAFIVIYTVNVKGKYKGKELPKADQSAHASSAWVKRGDKWQAVFHQECPVAPAPPAKPAAKAAASPAGTPAPAAATTGADPVANEKIVWELFKAKNFDAFATLLTSDFMEVETTGIYDKAASVKALSEFDFEAAKAALSDWKTVKLDDDAALVTYVVNMPGMPGNGERSSSIWTRRDGKWVAILHHGGTKVMPMPAATPVPPLKSGKAEPASPAKKP